MVAEASTTAQPDVMPEPRITVEYCPGRWGKIFHIFDTDSREISLHQRDAVKVAKSILKIAVEKR